MHSWIYRQKSYKIGDCLQRSDYQNLADLEPQVEDA